MPYPQDIIAEFAAELDLIWPGWRVHAPFSHLDPPTQARVKWLLKRHAMLTEKPHRDWPVKIVYDQGGKCYAHPICPPWPEGMAMPEPPAKVQTTAGPPAEKSDACQALDFGLSIARVRTLREDWNAQGKPGDFTSYIRSQVS